MAEQDQQEDFRKSLNALAEQQQKLLQQQGEILLKIADTDRRIKKDLWDRLGAIAPILSGTIIAIGGAYFTVAYNQQQLKLQEVQTIERFIPHLLGDEKSKRAAVLAISSIADAKLAAKVASIFASPGTVSALESIAENDTSTDRKALKGALARALDNMAESYRMDKRYEEAIVAYKRALALQEQSLGSNSAELVPNLNRIAEMHIIHKNYAEAETLLKRSSEIQKLTYGTDSNQFAAQLRKLAILYKEEGLDSKSQSILGQAVAIEQKLPATATGGNIGVASETGSDPAERETANSTPQTGSSQSQQAPEKSHSETSGEPKIITIGPEQTGRSDTGVKQQQTGASAAHAATLTQELQRLPELRTEDSESPE